MRSAQAWHHVTQLHQRGNIVVPMHAARQRGPVAPQRLVLPKELDLQIYIFFEWVIFNILF